MHGSGAGPAGVSRPRRGAEKGRRRRTRLVVLDLAPILANLDRLLGRRAMRLDTKRRRRLHARPTLLGAELFLPKAVPSDIGVRLVDSDRTAHAAERVAGPARGGHGRRSGGRRTAARDRCAGRVALGKGIVIRVPQVERVLGGTAEFCRDGHGTRGRCERCV